MSRIFDVPQRQELEISVSHNCVPVVTRILIDVRVRDPLTRVCLVRSLIELPRLEAIAYFQAFEAELKTLEWLPEPATGQ